MRIAIGLYDGFPSLDAVGPFQVFANLPGVELVLCADRRGLIADESGLLHIDVQDTFSEVTEPDVLLVPGGS